MEFIDIIVSGLSNGVGRALAWFTNPAGAFSFWPLLIAVLLAMTVTARQLRRTGARADARKVFAAAFPKEIYLHPSTRRDLTVFFFNEAVFFYAAFIVAMLVKDSLSGVPFIQADAKPVLPTALELVLLSLYFTLAVDFFSTFSHYLKHRVPFLWEFHKVHHSAPVMTPVTVARRHPVDMVVNAFIITGGVAIALLVWALVFNSTLDPVKIFGISVGLFAFRLLGYNLRHSHVWLDYGPKWSKVFISPAQHQIHHSNQPQHHDRNFGIIFAFWDRMFGTLYVPQKDEKIEFGIAPDEMADFETVRGMYIHPFRNVLRMLKPHGAAKVKTS